MLVATAEAGIEGRSKNQSGWLRGVNAKIPSSNCRDSFNHLSIDQSINHCRCLLELDLTCNRITAEGAAGLAKGVETNDILQVLKIQMNSDVGENLQQGGHRQILVRQKFKPDRGTEVCL